MYPHHYLGLFPPFPREHKIFVAMSFAPQFRSRWEKVISPAIRSVRVDDRPQQPHRVDASQISDSILTEILGGISNDRLIIADLTTIGSVAGEAVRNGNVMYEVGLAHAVRLPEEVLLFRSDSDNIPFDIANVRVNHYEPDGDPGSAKSQVSEAIVKAIREIDLKRHIAVKKAVQSLDFLGWSVLAQACTKGGVRHFETGTVAKSLTNNPRNATIARLLELGALATDWTTSIEETGGGERRIDATPSDDKFFIYKPTAFGMALYRHSVSSFKNRVLADEVLKKGTETQAEQKPSKAQSKSMSGS